MWTEVARLLETHMGLRPGEPLVLYVEHEAAAPEARAAWHAAATALGTDPDVLDLARRSNGDLHAARARYQRELAWAPPHMTDELRAARLARREHETEASIATAWARSAAGPRDILDERARAGKSQPPAQDPQDSDGQPRRRPSAGRSPPEVAAADIPFGPARGRAPYRPPAPGRRPGPPARR